MNTTISKFLKKYYVDGVIHTHVSLINPKGKFQFNREAFENFWDIYCNMIKDDDEDNDEEDEEDDEYKKLYVISINDEPYFYENSLKNARSKILKISNTLDLKNNKEYTSFISRKNSTQFDIIRNLNFIFFSYNYLLYSLKISTVQKKL